MTATAAPTATRLGASVPPGGARRAAGVPGTSFDEAMLALLLGAADGPPAAWNAPGDPAKDLVATDPAALPAAATPEASEGVATAEAFPLADLAMPWFASQQPASPALPRATGDALPDVADGTERAAGIQAKGARRLAAEPLDLAREKAPAESETAKAATAALPGTVEAARPEARKNDFAPVLTALQEARSPVHRAESAAPPPADAAPLAAEPGTAAFREGFAERVTILTRGGRSEAGITLHPADLGPIDVRIRIEDGVASFQFDAPLAETRQAIADSLPRLAEMLADTGLSLGGTHVGNPGSDAREPSPLFARASPADPDAADGPEDAPATPVRRVAIAAPGRVDLFA